MTVEYGHAFVLEAERRPRLRAVGNFQRLVAFHGGNANLGSHGGLRNGKRNDAMQIVSLALEKGMLFHVKHHVEIAGRTAELADLARAGKANARPVLNARGNLGINRSLLQHAALALALGAGVGDDIARPLASGTSAGDAEEALLIANLPAPGTRLARGWTFSRCRAGAVTGFTGFVTPHGHGGLRAEKCFFKFQRQVLAQIRAALHAAALASSTAAKHVVDAKKFAENVAEILETRAIESSALSTSAQSRMAIPVVDRALFRVGEDRIGFADLFELVLGIWIIGIPVRMMLQGQLAVRTLQFNFGDRAGYAQHFVVIAFCVRRQNMPFPSGNLRKKFKELVSSLRTRIARHLHHRGPQ